jgi:hypothetical protein
MAVFRGAAGRFCGTSLFRTSCPSSFGPVELFKINTVNFVEAFFSRKKKALVHVFVRYYGAGKAKA